MSCLIIAEAGVNHNGNMGLAYQLIDEATRAGADIVKFQSFKADKLVTRDAQKAAYQKANMQDGDDSQFNMLKRLELSEAMHLDLMAYCEKKGIRFLSTPFDVESAVHLSSLGITTGKIPSGEITNLPYLRTMARTFPEIIISSGMSDMEEVAAAIRVLTDTGTKKENIILLHCNTEYPTPMSDVNLRAMLTMHQELGVRVGYSDHTEGIEIPIAAVALGAVVIEKHFTLDKNMEGPDHKASLEPDELKAMVEAIRNIEKALGTGEKQPSPSEIKNKEIARKSIVAAQAISAGEVLSEENLTVKRPGNGISPMCWDEVVGSRAIKNFQADEQIIIS